MRITKPMTKQECGEFNLTAYKAIGIAEGFEQATCPREVLASWQYISTNELWRGMQGFFGRNVNTLISDGIIEKNT